MDINGVSIYFGYNGTIVDDGKVSGKTCDSADGVCEWMNECARDWEIVKDSRKELGGVMTGSRFDKIQ